MSTSGEAGRATPSRGRCTRLNQVYPCDITKLAHAENARLAEALLADTAAKQDIGVGLSARVVAFRSQTSTAQTGGVWGGPG